MAFVSVTRLRPRALRFLPGIILHSWRSAAQARRAPGFLGGYLATSRGPALWTVTAWADEAAMRAFRGGGAHRAAMRLLYARCDEASVAHWRTEDEGAAVTQAPPAALSPVIVADRLSRGRLSSVRHPSPAQAAGRTWPDGRLPRPGPRLRPRT